MSNDAFHSSTIDTEGDESSGARPREITHPQRGATCLASQSLCERFGFKPVYLTNYEMAMSDVFVEFAARDVLARGAGEVGMHLPRMELAATRPADQRSDFHFLPYLIEYPDQVMREKIKLRHAPSSKTDSIKR